MSSSKSMNMYSAGGAARRQAEKKRYKQGWIGKFQCSVCRGVADRAVREEKAVEEARGREQ